MTSPAQTRSHSAASNSSSAVPGVAALSWFQKLAPRSASTQPQCVVQRPRSGRGWTSQPGASSGNWSAKPARTRPSFEPIAPAPTHTTSPDVHSSSSSPLAGTGRRGTPARRAPASTRRSARPASRPERLDDGIDAAPLRRDPVPCRQESGQRLGLDRLDLPAQRGQRPAAQLAQHLAVAPLPPHALGTELAAHDPAVVLQCRQRSQRPAPPARRADRRPRRSVNGP